MVARGNDVGWRYALCNEMFEGWSLSRIAEKGVELGYLGMELAPYTLGALVTTFSAAERAQMRRDVESAGMEIMGLHWLLAQTAFQLNSPDAGLREATAQYLLDEIDFCAELGGAVLTFGSPQQREPIGGWSKDEAWLWTVEVMQRCGQRSQERGVVFCIEPLIGNRLVSGVDEAARLVREVDHPGFQMMVDCRSMGKDERWSVADQIKSVWPLVKHVHVNDPNSLGPGMGDLDFVPIMRALKELGFQGWLSLEAGRLELGPERISRESLANMKAALAAA